MQSTIIYVVTFVTLLDAAVCADSQTIPPTGRELSATDRPRLLHVTYRVDASSRRTRQTV